MFNMNIKHKLASNVTPWFLAAGFFIISYVTKIHIDESDGKT